MLFQSRVATALLVVTAALASSPVRATTADQICNAAADPCLIQTTVSVTPGSQLDFGTRTVHVTGSGSLAVASGQMDIACGTLIVDANGSVSARGSSSDSGGIITISTAGAASVAGKIDVSGNAAGTLTVNAGGTISLSGGSAATILANGLGNSAAGTVNLTGQVLTIDGSISATGGSGDSGGDIILRAHQSVAISKVIDVSGGEGDAGTIDIAAGGDVTMTSTATLRSNASSYGSGQCISVAAGDPDLGSGLGSLALAGNITATGGNNIDGGGDGGEVDLSASVDCQIDAQINVASGTPCATGGDVSLSCGDTLQQTAAVTGQISATGTGSESYGGTITIDTAGTLTVPGKLLAGGGQDGDSGEIDISSGNTMQLPGTIRVDASGYGFAGTVCLSSDLDLITSGVISADAGYDPDGGGDGGEVDVSTGTDCQIGGTLTAMSGHPDASGGTVSINCGDTASDSTAVSATIDVGGTGSGSDGGDICIDSSGPVSVTGKVFADGAASDAGTIELSSDTTVTVASGALVRAEASGCGSGGGITVSAGTTFSIAGTLSASGGNDLSGVGGGGSIDLSAEQSCQTSGSLSAVGGRPTGVSGDVSLSCGDGNSSVLTVTGPVDVSGTGSGSRGGTITLSADGQAVIQQELDASGGTQGGGDVSITATDALTISANITVSANGGGGAMMIISENGGVALSSGGILSADTSNSQGPAGAITITGCQVDTSPPSRITALGAQGTIELTGINRSDIAGPISAGPASGAILLSYRDYVPVIEGSAVLMPQPAINAKVDLTGCETGRPTPTTTPTPSRTPTPSATSTSTRTMTPTLSPTPTSTPTPTPTATLTPTPRPTPAGPGDANCDGRIDTADLLGLSDAIFDPMIQNDCRDGDANQDGAINAADYPDLVRRLLGDLPP